MGWGGAGTKKKQETLSKNSAEKKKGEKLNLEVAALMLLLELLSSMNISKQICKKCVWVGGCFPVV